MFHATTILAVRRLEPDGSVLGAMAGDGQVTMAGATVMKRQARKVRRIHNGQVIAGFAGSVADAFALFDRFEARLTEFDGNLHRAAVALAREWRTDRMLRRLEAMLLVMNRDGLLIVSGNGEVIEPDDGVAAIGSGGPYALAAARAMARHSDLKPAEIVRESLTIASEICVYTNDQITVEEI